MSSITAEAEAIVSGPRAEAYGPPEQSLEDIAAIFNALVGRKLKEPLTAKDAALMLVGMKLARESHQHKRDNLVDAIGYLVICNMIEEQGGD